MLAAGSKVQRIAVAEPLQNLLCVRVGASHWWCNAKLSNSAVIGEHRLQPALGCGDVVLVPKPSPRYKAASQGTARESQRWGSLGSWAQHRAVALLEGSKHSCRLQLKHPKEFRSVRGAVGQTCVPGCSMAAGKQELGMRLHNSYSCALTLLHLVPTCQHTNQPPLSSFDIIYLSWSSLHRHKLQSVD